MSVLSSLIAFILAIGILVTFHEFGHYWVARKLGVRVLCFSIGFGKPLYQWKCAEGIQYQIAAIPLGGYVKMLDEREQKITDPAEYGRAFNRQSLGVRSAIVAAGPAANFLLAFVLCFLMFIVGISGVRPIIGSVQPESVAEKVGIQVGDEILAVNTKPVRSWQEAGIAMLDAAASEQMMTLNLRSDASIERQVFLDTTGLNLLGDEGYMVALGISGPIPKFPAVVADIIPNGAAERYGLQVGDEVTAINDEPISDWANLVERIQNSPRANVNLTVERDGQIKTLPLVVDAFEENDQLIGRIGVRVDQTLAQQELDKYNVFISYGPLRSVSLAVAKTWEMTTLTLKILWQLLTGNASLKNISGPLTIAQVAGISMVIGIGTYLSTLMLLSISIGILNLLPIPMLDGGHLLYYLIEFFKGSPVSESTQFFAQRIGIALIGSLMILAIYNDIYRLVQ